MFNNQIIKESAELYSNFIENINHDFIEKCYDIFSKVKRDNGTIYIVGNGGSSAIANHFAIDMTKQGNIKTISFSDSSLITCLSNDFGYEEIFKKSLEYYLKKNDALIAISSSGKSKNIINALNFANEMVPTIGLTGFQKDNHVFKHSNVSLCIECEAYNIIENMHQIYLLMLVDMMKGKIVYSA